MDLRQLEYFQAVGRMNNITRAAAALHVSQPSITISIQRLEEELGVVLFDRGKKQLSLTAEGKVFLSRVDRILKDLEDAVIEMNDYRELKKGLLRLGVPPMIGTYLFPKIFSSFRNKYPYIELDIVENGSLATGKMIEKGDLDLGIIIISEALANINTREISQSEIVVCVNSNHPFSKRDKIKIEDLKDDPIIMMREGFYHREKLLESFKRHNIKPNTLLTSSQLDTIKSLVANGMGISFLLKEVLENEKGIIGIPLEEKVTVSIGLAWSKDRYLSKASQIFIDWCHPNDSFT